jgi:hypothetical protein
MLTVLAAKYGPQSSLAWAVAHKAAATLPVWVLCGWNVLPPDALDRVIRSSRPRAGQLPMLFDRLLAMGSVRAGEAIDAALAGAE